jgi:photoactive yellow protein
MRLLVLEDNPEISEALAVALIDQSFDVSFAADGIEAMHRLSHEHFDVALLDVEVPYLSGLGVQRAVSDFSKAAVIVMSASVLPWQREAFAAGATACLTKPFDLKRLLGLLKTIETATREQSGPWASDVRQLSDADLKMLAELSPAELDALPFGAICLAPDGRVLRYNAFESSAAGFPQPQVVGRRFSEIAPCSTVRQFGATLREGFASRRMDSVLRFIFPHHGLRSVVSVRFYFDQVNARMWLFISKRRGEADAELALEADALDQTFGKPPRGPVAPVRTPPLGSA